MNKSCEITCSAISRRFAKSRCPEITACVCQYRISALWRHSSQTSFEYLSVSLICVTTWWNSINWIIFQLICIIGPTSTSYKSRMAFNNSGDEVTSLTPVATKQRRHDLYKSFIATVVLDFLFLPKTKKKSPQTTMSVRFPEIYSTTQTIYSHWSISAAWNQFTMKKYCKFLLLCSIYPIKDRSMFLFWKKQQNISHQFVVENGCLVSNEWMCAGDCCRCFASKCTFRIAYAMCWVLCVMLPSFDRCLHILL